MPTATPHTGNRWNWAEFCYSQIRATAEFPSLSIDVLA